jgi:hypothetical protein
LITGQLKILSNGARATKIKVRGQGEVKDETVNRPICVRTPYVKARSIELDDEWTTIPASKTQRLLLSIPLSRLAKQSLFCGCFLPGPRRFLRGTAYCSELVAKKLADSYPKIIGILIVRARHSADRTHPLSVGSLLLPMICWAIFSTSGWRYLSFPIHLPK